MKKVATFTLLLISFFTARAQVSQQEMANRKRALTLAASDTAKIRLLLSISGGYRFSNIDSSLHYSYRALLFSRKAGFILGEASALSDRGSIFLESGDIPNALMNMLAALDIADNAPESYLKALSIGGIENRIGNVYMELGEYKTSILHYKIAMTLFRKFKFGGFYNEMSNIGNDYEMIGLLDSAKFYLQKVYNAELAHPDNSKNFVFAELSERLGNLEGDMGHYNTALMHFRTGVHEAMVTNNLRNLSVLYLKMALLFKKLQVTDSSFFYAKKTLTISRLVSMKKSIYEASFLLSGLFESKHQPDSALFFAKLSANVKDSLYGPKTFQQLQLLALREQARQQQLVADKKKLKYTYLVAFMAFALGVFLLIALIFWRNNRRQKITNRKLSAQKEEILTQRNSLDDSFNKLKQTQTQLIQSEKMASLGELTAGIAHEIQNPLNFVNNFSEVNTELIEEMEKEIDNGDLAEIKTLAGDIRENEKKINMHGKRADAIVKGMLQHSQSGSGAKEPTNINSLTDENMRLAYHGLSAKDKAFNAEMITHFDENLPKINVIPQDIGRVLLNLFNNAFYAVNQKQKTADEDYKPEVTVTTDVENSLVVIKVKDNGVGIPDAIKEKIMQPFFTTKPTGEGTGLGLSLTYDMVVKGHGGNLTVDSKEGEFTTFMVELPIQN